MAVQKWCSATHCKNFIFATLSDFDLYGWSAIKSGKQPTKYFCPNHQYEFAQAIKKDIWVNRE